MLEAGVSSHCARSPHHGLWPWALGTRCWLWPWKDQKAQCHPSAASPSHLVSQGLSLFSLVASRSFPWHRPSTPVTARGTFVNCGVSAKGRYCQAFLGLGAKGHQGQTAPAPGAAGCEVPCPSLIWAPSTLRQPSPGGAARQLSLPGHAGLRPAHPALHIFWVPVSPLSSMRTRWPPNPAQCQ